MVKVRVNAPPTRWLPATTILYWMTFSLFGMVSELFKLHCPEPWYCSPSLAQGLANWNNMSISDRPKKLVNLIKFYITDEIDIGSYENPGESQDVPETNTLLEKTQGVKISLPVANSSTSSSSSSSSSSTFTVGKVSPVTNNKNSSATTTTLSVVTTKSQHDPEAAKTKAASRPKQGGVAPKRKASANLSTSGSESGDDPVLDDKTGEEVGKNLHIAHKKNKQEKRAAKKQNALIKFPSADSGIPQT